MSILITGGAGYIGSHAARQLIDRSYSVVVLDNLSTGHRWAIPSSVPFYQGNISDSSLVAKIIREHQVDSVMHFAALTDVGQSVLDPELYEENNYIGSQKLIDTAASMGVRNFIFSSTAAVYGDPSELPVSEKTKPAPINPYGMTKLKTEDYLKKNHYNMRYLILRYFNVAGARLDGTLGQSTPRATHLIKVAAEAACGKRSLIKIFGTDYSTRDGTCIRDYIHVEDLCDAHILALEKLSGGLESQIFNLGYGQGYSVKEVISMMKKVSDVDFKVETAPRRIGDSVEIIANSTRAHQVLGWSPKYNSLEVICRTSYLWEKNLETFLQKMKTKD
ncbi:MAG: UDP-glucose 4-epimerase GalE [Oligoflexia bacterium]|nr:MAG: UDP-glucose 4-epimerase GalE [Oligoflexia bacterium]